MTISMSLFKKKKKTKIERKLKIRIIRSVGEGLILVITPSFVSLFSPLTPSYHMYSVSIWWSLLMLLSSVVSIVCDPGYNLSFFEK